MQTRFAPALNVLFVGSHDQYLRYPDLDPRAFIDGVEAQWAGNLRTTYVTERDDIVGTVLEARWDCLVILSGALHNASICQCVEQLVPDIASLVEDGRGLVLMHPGNTDSTAYLPSTWDISHEEHRCDAPSATLSPEGRQLLRGLIDPDARFSPTASDYGLGYWRFVGAGAQEAIPIIEGPETYLVSAATRGSGRLVLSPLMMDWHGYHELAAAILMWASGVAVNEADDPALASFVARHAKTAFVPSITTDPIDTWRLETVDHTLVVSTRSAVPMWLEHLAERSDGTRWEMSSAKTLDVLAHLVHANTALPPLDGELDYARDQLRNGAGIPSSAHMYGYALSGAGLDVGSWSTSQATEHIGTLRPERLVELWVLCGSDAAIREACGSRAVELQHTIEPGSAHHRVLAAIAKDEPIEWTLESAERLVIERRPRNDVLATIDAALELGARGSDCLSALAYALTSVADSQYRRANSAVIARHVDFWTRHAELFAPALAKLLANQLPNAFERANDRSSVELQLAKARVREAWDLLGITAHNRSLTTPMHVALKGSTNGDFARALPGLLRLAFASAMGGVLAVVGPVLFAGGIALLPLLSSDALTALELGDAWMRFTVAGLLVVPCIVLGVASGVAARALLMGSLVACAFAAVSYRMALAAHQPGDNGWTVGTAASILLLGSITFLVSLAVLSRRMRPVA